MIGQRPTIKHSRKTYRARKQSAFWTLTRPVERNGLGQAVCIPVEQQIRMLTDLVEPTGSVEHATVWVERLIRKSIMTPTSSYTHTHIHTPPNSSYTVSVLKVMPKL